MDTQWLQKQFKIQPQKTKSGLARALDLEPSAISKMLNGTRQIKAHEYIAMCAYFNVTETAAAEAGRSYKVAPLSSDNEHFEDRDERRNAEWVIPKEIISQRTKAAPEQVKVFQVGENVMEPDFKRGESVLVDLSDTKPSPPGIFIVSDGFGYMLRKCEFLPGSAPPEIKISTNSPSFEPQICRAEKSSIIGRVIGKLQWL